MTPTIRYALAALSFAVGGATCVLSTIALAASGGWSPVLCALVGVAEIGAGAGVLMLHKPRRRSTFMR